jgi:hypothetical protein
LLTPPFHYEPQQSCINYWLLKGRHRFFSVCISNLYRHFDVYHRRLLSPYLSAEEFIKRGYITYATARNISKMDGLPTTSNVHKLELDVTSDENVKDVIATILEEQKKIDIVVNNAGMMVPG